MQREYRCPWSTGFLPSFLPRQGVRGTWAQGGAMHLLGAPGCQPSCQAPWGVLITVAIAIVTEVRPALCITRVPAIPSFHLF